MKKINLDDLEDFIEEILSGNKENISDGGSACYDYGDNVVVAYETSTKYGLARDTAEEIMQKVNERVAQGINTPNHFAIVRQNVGDKNFCFVAQEKAKGISFKNYSNLKDANKQIEMQKLLLSAPDKHFENLIKDLKGLFNMGLELKPKNVFYDKDANEHGFTIIDLLCVRGHEYNNSYADVLRLKKLAGFVPNYTFYYDYNDQVSDQAKTSKILSSKLKLKIFNAMEKEVESFKDIRREVLRTYKEEDLKVFKANGLVFDDLTLTESEEKKFQKNVLTVAESAVEHLKLGMEIWDIDENFIRLEVETIGLDSEYKYFDFMQEKKSSYEDEYSFDSACSRKVQSETIKVFKRLLEKENENNPSTFLNDSIKELSARIDKKERYDESNLSDNF